MKFRNLNIITEFVIIISLRIKSYFRFIFLPFTCDSQEDHFSITSFFVSTMSPWVLMRIIE